MRNDHGIAIDDEERPAKRALQQSLEVAFTRVEEKNRELVSRDEQSILRNVIKLDAFYEAQIQLNPAYLPPAAPTQLCLLAGIPSTSLRS